MKQTILILSALVGGGLILSAPAWAETSNKATEDEIISELETLVVPRNGSPNVDEDDSAESLTPLRPTSSFSRSSQPSSRRLWGINVFGYFSGASHIQTDGASSTDGYSSSYSAQTASRITGEYRSNISGGLGVEHSKKRLFKTGPVSFGYDAGAAYEFGRTIFRDQIQSYSSSTQAATADPSIAFFLPYAHANVSYGRTYLFGGINYSIPQATNAADEDFDGNVGYQVGFGSRITSWVAVEMIYRHVNFAARSRLQNNTYGTSYYGSTYQGLGIYDQEQLSISGFNLALKVMF
ncbi:MAG: hypothetical protein H6626_00695 [Pseudobdellovibrionaceae bacterium]|nr:hypothetical protein [Bdellovibrionales bacterium]USN47641.1 MAG: hypothetical protein H6626_00695 [Pseudobdellovibrionaceae bacterium]